MRTGSCEAESNHIHVAAAAGELGIGTGTFHQSTFCVANQLSGDVPAQAAFADWFPNQFDGSVQPMLTLVHVLPWSVDSCVPAGVIMYHQVPNVQPAICAERNCPCMQTMLATQ